MRLRLGMASSVFILAALGCGVEVRPATTGGTATPVTPPIVTPVAPAPIAPAGILPSGGRIVTTGDSLCDGHGLPGFIPYGYPNTPPPTAWPELVANVPEFSGISVVNTCADGIGIAQMIAEYPTAVHPLSPAVTKVPGILVVSIIGNDYQVVATEGIAAYESEMATFYATARGDGWKVLFLAQWEQTGRLQYGAERVAFNQWNLQNGDYYLDVTSWMNDPTDLTYYEADGLHPNVAASQRIAENFSTLFFAERSAADCRVRHDLSLVALAPSFSIPPLWRFVPSSRRLLCPKA